MNSWCLLSQPLCRPVTPACGSGLPLPLSIITDPPESLPPSPQGPDQAAPHSSKLGPHWGPGSSPGLEWGAKKSVPEASLTLSFPVPLAFWRWGTGQTSPLPPRQHAASSGPGTNGGGPHGVHRDSMVSQARLSLSFVLSGGVAQGQDLDRCLTRRTIPTSEDVLTVDEIFCKANSSFLREDSYCVEDRSVLRK